MLWRMPSSVDVRSGDCRIRAEGATPQPSLNRATWSRPGWSSPALNVRPVGGPTRNAAKNSDVTRAPDDGGIAGAVRLAPDARREQREMRKQPVLARNSRYWWSARAG